MTDAYRQTLAENGSTAPWVVHLLLARPVEPPLDALRTAIGRRLGHVDEVKGEGTVLTFAHPGLVGSLGVPMLTSVMPTDRAPVAAEVEPSLRQTWDWPEARTEVARAGATWFVTDMLAGGVDGAKRLAVFHTLVRAVLDAVPVVAVHWLPSQRFVRPTQWDDGPPALEASAINVRLHRVEETEGEIVMDTIGMAAFDLPDVQMHFAGLDETRVAAKLAGIAKYLFERGDVIADGNTVDGLEPGERWKCGHDDSIVEPNRTVLAVHSGRHAAGR